MVKQEKRWDWKHMLYYEMRIGQCKIAPNDWYEKDAQKGKRLIWKRCPEKGKYWYEKDAQMGKDCDEKWFTYY